MEAIFVHEDYFSVIFGSDIALLQLAEPTTTQSTPIHASTIELNDRGFVAGWGALDSADDVDVQTLPLELHGAAVNMVPGFDCSQRFADYNDVVNDSQLCAGVPAGGVDTCQGDSGGPLYYIHDNNELSLAGITSWGIGCGLAESPGIYTRVSSFRTWIDDTIANETDTLIVEPRPAAAPGTRSSGGGGSISAGLAFLMCLLFIRLRYLKRLQRVSGRTSSIIATPLTAQPDKYRGKPCQYSKNQASSGMVIITKLSVN